HHVGAVVEEGRDEVDVAGCVHGYAGDGRACYAAEDGDGGELTDLVAHVVKDGLAGAVVTVDPGGEVPLDGASGVGGIEARNRDALNRRGCATETEGDSGAVVACDVKD